MSKSIKFPASHYIGMIARQNDDLPLAFATPDGADSAAEKRKGTVDAWVERNAHQTVWDAATQRHVRITAMVPKPVVMKNEAMAGFRLLDDIRRGGGGWGQGNVKWRVEDPRGFELEITSPNLMQIMACSVVDRGEILDACMWAREGGDNVLVPVSSEVYTTAMENTVRVAKSASLRDLAIGDTAILTNGETGRYYGRMNVIEHDYRKHGYGSAAHTDLVIKLTPRHLFVDADTKQIHSIASPKLSEVVAGEAMDKDTAEHHLAQLIGDGYKVVSGGWGTNHGYTFSKVPPTVTREKTEVEWNARASQVFEMDGKWYLSHYAYGGGDEVEALRIHEHDWITNSFVQALETRQSYSFYRHNVTKYSVSDLKAKGIKAYRPSSRITTDKGAVFVVQH